MNCRFLIASLLSCMCLAGVASAASVSVADNSGTGQDAFVYSFSAVNFPVSTGYNVVPVGKTGTGHNTSGLVKFDLSGTALTAAQVTSATLRLYSADPSGTGFGLAADASHPIQVNVSPLQSDWNRNTVKYSTRPAAGAQETSFSVDHVNDWITVDLTNLVKSWLTSPVSNFGVYLDANAPVAGAPGVYYFAAFDSGWIPANPNDPNSVITLNNLTAPQLVINSVPEPGTLILAGLAMPAAVWMAWRRASRRSAVAA